MERELTELAFLYSAPEFGRRFPTFLPSFLCQGCRKGEKHLRMAALARGKRQHEVRTLDPTGRMMTVEDDNGLYRKIAGGEVRCGAHWASPPC